MTNRQLSKKDILTPYQMALIAILSALATGLYALQIPVVAFYKLDFSNLAVLLGGFAMGPIEALMILLIKAMLGLLWTTSAGVGELADFIMGAALVLPAVILYHRNKTRKTAILGLGLGTLCMIVVSVFVNKWIMIPFYMGAFHDHQRRADAHADEGGVLALVAVIDDDGRQDHGRAHDEVGQLAHASARRPEQAEEALDQQDHQRRDRPHGEAAEQDGQVAEVELVEGDHRDLQDIQDGGQGRQDRDQGQLPDGEERGFACLTVGHGCILLRKYARP